MAATAGVHGFTLRGRERHNQARYYLQRAEELVDDHVADVAERAGEVLRLQDATVETQRLEVAASCGSELDAALIAAIAVGAPVS